MKGLVIKILLYLILVVTATVSIHRFLVAYQERMEQAAHRLEREEAQLLGEEVPPGATNEVATNLPPAAATTSTNDVGAVTNTVAAGSEGPETAAAPSGETTAARPAPLGWYGAGGLLAIIGLALLAAHDFSRYVASRAHKALYDPDAEGAGDKDYEEAERLWANEDYLGAIQLLRDYLKRHPRRVHAHFRIAEIYEKNLQNLLAAALEHEEILKFKLEDERWGWTAIHLCNLYYRLNQPEKAEALLHRIVEEYGHTQAARKARKRLGLPEDLEEAQAQAEAQAGAAAGGETGQPPAAEDQGGFRLPPGFRPK